jgi:hypothetical protein
MEVEVMENKEAATCSPASSVTDLHAPADRFVSEADVASWSAVYQF